MPDPTGGQAENEYGALALLPSSSTHPRARTLPPNRFFLLALPPAHTRTHTYQPFVSLVFISDIMYVRSTKHKSRGPLPDAANPRCARSTITLVNSDCRLIRPCSAHHEGFLEKKGERERYIRDLSLAHAWLFSRVIDRPGRAPTNSVLEFSSTHARARLESKIYRTRCAPFTNDDLSGDFLFLRAILIKISRQGPCG